MYKITELVSKDIESRALAINNSGQVAGVAAQHDFLWDPITGKELLPTLAAYNGAGARGINDAGHVIGCSLLCQGQSCMEGRAFLYRDVSLRDLQASEYSCATAINGADQVTGYSNMSGSFWSGGTLTNIKGGDFSEIEPCAINEAGEVAAARWETVPSLECSASSYPLRWANGSLRSPSESKLQ